LARVNSWIGSAVPRLEDRRFVRGEGRYVDDLAPAGLVHAAFLRSPIAHGRIARLEVGVAARLDGVIGVVTAADLEPLPHIPVRMEPRSELTRFQQPVLAVEKVRYVGEPIAVVLAETPYLAQDALAAIETEFDTLAPVIDARSAATGSTHLFERYGTNLAMTISGVQGDAGEAFRDAPYIRSEIFRVHRHAASPMEPRGILAQWSGEMLVVHGACKVPFAIRSQLARDLGLPPDAIEVVESDVGGGFGVRGEYYPEDFLIPWCARRFARPVKWIETRQEHLLATTHAREVEIELAIACTREGTIVGLRGSAWFDTGAYIRPNAVTAPRNLAQVVAGPYRVPHLRMDVALVMTSKTPSGSYRGPGRYEADFARERLIDLAARDLGIDVVEMRRRNLLTASEMPYELPQVLPYGHRGRCDSGHYPQALDRCLAEIGWERIAALSGECIEGRYHGVGVGCYIEGGGSGPRENAALTLDARGNVVLHVGSSAIGQGLETICAQIAADALGVPLAMIASVLHGSTSVISEGFGSYASRSTVMGGNAIVDAAENLVERVRVLAAPRLGCAAADVRLEGLERAQCGERSVRVCDLVAALPAGSLSAAGSFVSTERTYSFGTHAAHVTVDPETGEVEVLDYVAVEDVGRIVNPQTLHGQALGAIVQGLGGTLIEELCYDRDGQLLAGSLMDYAMPVARSFPRVKVIATENWPSPFNPLGVKGAGEGGIIPVAGVIANAVASALVLLDVKPHDLPLSANRVWRLMRAAEEIMSRGGNVPRQSKAMSGAGSRHKGVTRDRSR
jgi:aerobic carbon-monoxide dehydrogenase large subunit